MGICRSRCLWGSSFWSLNCRGLVNFLYGNCPRGKTITHLISYGNQSNKKGKGKGNTRLTNGSFWKKQWMGGLCWGGGAWGAFLLCCSGIQLQVLEVKKKKKSVIHVTSTNLCYISFVYVYMGSHVSMKGKSLEVWNAARDGDFNQILSPHIVKP